MAEAEYVPGVCNIGKAEIRMRRVLAWGATVATVALIAALIASHTPKVWRLTAFVPASVAAVGFIQAAWHFCANFGLRGVFNFGANVGKTDTVEQAEWRRQDRRTALQIIGLSLLVGTVVAAAAYFLPL